MVAWLPVIKSNNLEVRKLKSKLMMTMLALTMALALVAGGTMAWFTANDDAGEAVFTAGTLKVDVSDGLTTFANLLPNSKHGNMNPGDVYDEIEIIIENTGTKNLIWFGDWSASLTDSTKTDALLDGIYIHSMKMEFLAPAGGTWNEPTDQFITDGIGSGAYPGWYNTLAAQGPFPVVSLRSWLDNNGMGVTPNEHMGALKPGYKYKLTVQFGFYFAADNNYQGDVASPVEITFAVNATQVVADAITAIGIPNAASHVTWALGQLANQN